METPVTLLGLVERYSPSGQEEAAVEWLVERMRALEFKRAFRDQAGNAVGIMGDGPRQMVLLGHIDTVAGRIAVRVEDGILFGRGAVDAKGPLAGFVDAVAGIGAVPGWECVVIGAVGEEAESPGARFVSTRYHPDLAVVGEPSGWDRITLGYKGSASAQIEVRWPMRHTASPEPSACELAIELWGEVQSRAREYSGGSRGVFEQLTPSLRGWASGGDGFSEWAQLRIGVRLPPGLSPDGWYALVAGACDRVGAEMQPLGEPVPAYRGQKNNALVRAFVSSIRQAEGEPGFLLKSGTSDLNLVAPAWGCPAVAYGPGDSSLDHTPHEHISLVEYERAVSVLERLIRTLAETTAT
jgi:LysW-gamma-L-lysine carboxypeptidase